MLYQCVLCGAQYTHDDSYDHNSYRCPKRKRKGSKMKVVMTGLLVMVLVSSAGCSMFKDFFGGKVDCSIETNKSKVECESVK